MHEHEAEQALRAAGSRRRYPWGRLLDGSMHVLQRGEDYDDPQVLRVAASSAAARKGMRVKVRVLEANKIALVAVVSPEAAPP